MRRDGNRNQGAAPNLRPHLRLVEGGAGRVGVRPPHQWAASAPARGTEWQAAVEHYLNAAERWVEDTSAHSVNAAREDHAAPQDLLDAHDHLTELTGVDGGDYMFVLIEQRTGITVERRFRLTDYPVRTTSSVWAQPLSRYHFAGQIRRRL